MGANHVQFSRPVWLLALLLSLLSLLLFAFRPEPRVAGASAPSAPAACTGGPHGGTLPASQTWCAADNPHLVTSNLIVGTGNTLTLEPGVIVQFNSGTGLDVSGGLEAKGAEGQLITLTGAAPVCASWTQLMVRSGSTVNLDYCDFGYAGGSNVWGAIEIYSDNVTIDHCTIHDNGGQDAAIRIMNPGRSPAIRNTSITASLHYPIRQSTPDMTPTYLNLTFTGNEYDAVNLGNGNITRPVTLDGGELHSASPQGHLSIRSSGSTLPVVR